MKPINLHPTELIGVVVPERVANRIAELPPAKHDNARLVGTISSNLEFDFDCEPYINKKFNNRYFEYLGKDLMRVSSMLHSYPFLTPEESFLSLIKSHGIQIKDGEKLIILNEIK